MHGDDIVITNDGHDGYQDIKDANRMILVKRTEGMPEIKLLNTTKRIRQFSNNRDPTSQDKVVYIDGNWDIVHEGHIKNLEKAKSLGSYLIVGLHDDETINKIKGRNYPVLNLQERTLNVLALKYVDEVIIGAPWQISQNMIKNMNI